MSSKHNRTSSTTEQKSHPHPHSYHAEKSNKSESSSTQTTTTTTCTNHRDYLNPLHDINYIAYGIFLGSYRAACKPFLLQNNITHVLSIGKDSEDDLSPEITVKKMQLEDEADAKISDILDEACQFISEGTKGNNMILIHCNAGQSRSPAVVIHYLYRHKGFPMSCAFFFVATRRPVIAINPAFRNYIMDEAMKESSKITREHFNFPGDRRPRAYKFKLNKEYLKTNMKRLEKEMGVSLKPPEEVKKDKVKIKFPPSEE